MERTRVLVCCGDIRGFGTWIKRPANAPEDVRALMHEIYDEYSKFGRVSGGSVKFLGDGIMIVLELKNGHNCSVATDFMRRSVSFSEKVAGMMQKFWPRPDGFRLRLVSGYVYKDEVAIYADGVAVRAVEYFGYAINLAERLLYVEPSVLCICHESVKQILGGKRHGLRLDPVKHAAEKPRGVDTDDLSGLWSFRMDNRREKTDRRST